MKTIKSYSTIGLLATHKNLKKPTLVRVCLDVKEDNSVLVYAESGHTLNKIRYIGQKIITREGLSNLDDDPYNDVVFARAAFEMLDLTICEG